MYKLKGKVHHYAWGGNKFIPELLNISNPENQPFAEYWMGAHPSTPSVVWLTENAHTNLPVMIRSDPARYLGEKVNQAFGELPYLLKVLDVKDMLSIQVHPTREEARLGFQRENELQIPVDAYNRNYKDDNHKPEVMIALSDFWLLHGFLPETSLKKVLESVPEFNSLLPLFEEGGYKGLYSFVMGLTQSKVDEMLQPLADRLLPLYSEGKLSKMSPDFWAARAIAGRKDGVMHLDRGIFSIYFFNLVYLREGEGIFQGAGIPHAYLEGQNMELMSNSDNVLRGGLTPKHIDVPELLKHVQFVGIKPEILKGEWKGWVRKYDCPVPDFTIGVIELPGGETIARKSDSVEIYFIQEGDVEVQGRPAFNLSKGEAGVAFSGEEFKLTAVEKSKVFFAAVP